MIRLPNREARLWTAIGVLAAFELLRVAGTFFAHPPLGLGWDFRVLCDALDVLRRGGNPYPVANLADHVFDYPYLPTIAYLVSPACAVSPRGSVAFAFLFLAILAGSVALAARGLGAGWRDAAILAACSLTAFDVGRWIVLTGNAAILEVPLAALAVVLWHRGRTAGAGAAIGALASFKLLPIVLLGAFPLLLPDRRGLRAAAAGLAAFLPIVAFGLWLAGPNVHDYLRTITGEIPGQHSPFHEHLLGISDPNLPDFLTRLSAAAGLAHPGPPATALALLFFAAGALLVWLRKAAGPRAGAFCVTLIVLALALFRLKPYAYASLTVFAMAACLEKGRIVPARLLSVVAGLAAARLASFLPRFGPVLSDYYQLVSLLLALAALYTLQITGSGAIRPQRRVREGRAPLAAGGHQAGEAASSLSIGSQV